MMKVVKNRLILFIVVCIASVCAVLASIGVYTYFSTTSQGSGGLPVAKLDVELTNIPDNQTLNAGGTLEIEFTVTNRSDVNCMYDIVVTLPSALNRVSLRLDQPTLEFDSVSQDRKIYTEVDAGGFYINGAVQSAKHKLIFIAAADAPTVTLSNIKVTVRLKQFIDDGTVNPPVGDDDGDYGDGWSSNDLLIWPDDWGSDDGYFTQGKDNLVDWDFN